MTQILAALWSLVFIFSIFSGYFLLLKNNIFFAVVVGAVLSLAAWNMARLIGSQENGIAKNRPLFAMLIIISAVGIMNFLMLNLEGRKIFSETIAESEDRFTALQSRAQGKLAADGIAERIKSIENLKESLIAEINNPVNCGQGPQARAIMAELGRQLPGFVALSNPSADCSANAKVIDEYRKKIDGLVDRAPWNNADLSAVVKSAEGAKSQLQTLDGQASSSFAYALMLNVAPQLQQLGVRYRGDHEKLARHASTEKLPPRLDLDSVNNLGEWSQLINLVLERWNKPSTWLYAALAIFFDYFMLYLFELVRRNRTRYPSNAPQGTVGKAW